MDTSQSENPFMPSATLNATDGLSESGNQQTHLLLKQTRPWVSALGILAIVFGVLGILGGVGMVFVGIFNVGGVRGSIGAWAGIAVMYTIFGVLYFFPGYFLISYSRRIKDYLAKPTHENLNAALKAQKSFWKFVGMSILITFVVYVVMFIGMIGFQASRV